MPRAFCEREKFTSDLMIGVHINAIQRRHPLDNLPDSAALEAAFEISEMIADKPDVTDPGSNSTQF